MSRSQRFVAGLTIGLLGITIGGFSLWGGRSHAVATSPAEPMLRVETQQITASDAYEVKRSFVGRVEAARESELGFELAGLLEKVWVEEGDDVQRGQHVAALDTERLRSRRTELVAAREQALAQLQLARSTDARVAEAAELNAVSTQESDEARQGLQTRAAAAQQLEAQIQSLDVEISKSTLRAPYTGVVSARRVDEGEVLEAGRSVVRLLEAGRLEARVGISEAEAAVMARGDELPIVVRGQTVKGRVKAVLPEREASTRTVTVLLELPEAATARSGDLAEIQLTRSVPESGYWLPTSALVESVRGLWSCYVVEPYDDVSKQGASASSGAASDGAISGGATSGGATFQVARRDVEILHATTDRVYVRGTLRPGERVILDGVHRVVPGQPVLLAEDVAGREAS